MGFLDDIFAGVKTLTDEVQGIKDEFISTIVDPSGELRDTINEIAGEITGSASNATASPAASIDPTTDDTV